MNPNNYQYSYGEVPTGTVYYSNQQANYQYNQYPVYQYQGYIGGEGATQGQIYTNQIAENSFQNVPGMDVSIGQHMYGGVSYVSQVPIPPQGNLYYSESDNQNNLESGYENQNYAVENAHKTDMTEESSAQNKYLDFSSNGNRRGHQSRGKSYSSQSRRPRNYPERPDSNDHLSARSIDSNKTAKVESAKVEKNWQQEQSPHYQSRQNYRGKYSSRSFSRNQNNDYVEDDLDRSSGRQQNSRQPGRGSGRFFQSRQTDRRYDNRQNTRGSKAVVKIDVSDNSNNLTDEEKERLGVASVSSQPVNQNRGNKDHLSIVEKVDDLINSHPGNRGNKAPTLKGVRSGKSFNDDERKTSYGNSRKEMPSSRSNKKKVSQPGNPDETQRESYVDQLRKGSYECMVCCCTIRCEVAVWSCDNCYHIFHLYCIKKWARSPAAIIEGGEGWRCPSCQNVSDRVPNQYKCFCGKRVNPDYDRFETPHSCGEVCGRQRNANCPHACNILCHPGACPPCEAMVNKTCECGKNKRFIRCIHSAKFRCETVCEKELNCGKHQCKAVCHKGPCSMCEETREQECYGGHTSRSVTCGTEEALYDSYSCRQPCDKLLDCGHHRCESACHVGPCDSCPRQPSAVTHCPCGKTELSTLTDISRDSCLDLIPLCDQICGKTLTCGPDDESHKCEQKCHDGPCGPCQGSSSRRCRCGLLEKELPCEEAMQYTETSPFLCEKRCIKKRMCGRHKCNLPCCVNEEHICELVCGRKLTCGLHKCEYLCHRGNCSTCLQASFTELTCTCGAAVLHPPVACGTRPPECTKLCNRTHPCGHPVTHRCHSDAKCPPCTVLTEKRCMGKHELRKNIPCHRQEVSCGLPCRRPLPCGKHTCKKTCHKGECLEEGERCSQLCPLPRSDCGHPCSAVCHSGSPCPKSQCRTKIVIKCKCGNHSARVTCSSGGLKDITDFQRMATENLASSLSSLQTGQSVDISELAAARKSGVKQLECDKDCALIERNKRVALALEIRNPDLSAKLGNPPYSQFLKDFAKQFPQFVSGVEKSMSDLVQSAKQSKQLYRRHPFPPMNMNQRRTIHELAEFYGCETESYDQEPKKNVVATAHRDRCWLPSVTLTSLVQRELQPKAPMPIPHKHSETELRDAVREMKLSTDVYTAPKKMDVLPRRHSPVVDYFDMTD